MNENKDVFADGQWWLAELDQMVANGTPDQKRAVAVVRNLVRQHNAAPAPVALANTDRALVAFRAMRSKDAIAHRERMANAPKGACESCYWDGEIGGQFCGGFETCAECSGTGRANGGKATGQQGGAA